VAERLGAEIFVPAHVHSSGATVCCYRTVELTRENRHRSIASVNTGHNQIVRVKSPGSWCRLTIASNDGRRLDTLCISTAAEGEAGPMTTMENSCAQVAILDRERQRPAYVTFLSPVCLSRIRAPRK
jgi:hypothetical protein